MKRTKTDDYFLKVWVFLKDTLTLIWSLFWAITGFVPKDATKEQGYNYINPNRRACILC